MGTEFNLVDAIGTGGLFAFGMSALVHMWRPKATGLERQINLFWGYWDYVFIVLLSVPLGLMVGFSDPGLSRKMFGAGIVFLVALGIARYVVKSQLQWTSTNSSTS